MRVRNISENDSSFVPFFLFVAIGFLFFKMLMKFVLLLWKVGYYVFKYTFIYFFNSCMTKQFWWHGIILCHAYSVHACMHIQCVFNEVFMTRHYIVPSVSRVFSVYSSRIQCVFIAYSASSCLSLRN